ncbi:MAG: deoxyribodipyrimidine photo-lyase [Betaproteobacteria bacterium]|nr:deoxyribodipyrimidine photo-lyase [Betaproteobacteria bacterium]
MTSCDRALVWFRRDLRASDHAALSHALMSARAVWCVFVFDTDILDALPSREDRRVEFIWHTIVELRLALEALGGGLSVAHGRAREVIPRLADELGVDAVFANRDYEPDAIARDVAVAETLAASGRRLVTFKDQCIFEKDEILTQAGKPYSVFTAYKNAWLKRVDAQALSPCPVEAHAGALVPDAGGPVPSLASLGFSRTNLTDLKLPLGIAGGRALLEDFAGRIDHYAERRDFPAVRGPSYLSVHLRFGTVSLRELARLAYGRNSQGARTWLSELVWRDFYFQILWHFPRVVNRSFKPEFDTLRFENRDDWFEAWCEGRTGYPIVDAAMRQLNTTGYMHNRLRMISASFLVKDLRIDWRRGERYFAARLNDYDLAANNGGWQWAASTGCDAQPYFRIFNPVSQSEKFDPEGRFIRQYLPVLAEVPNRCIHAPWTMSPIEARAARVVIGENYPAPIVDHAEARKLALAMFAAVKSSAGRGPAAG